LNESLARISLMKDVNDKYSQCQTTFNEDITVLYFCGPFLLASDKLSDAMGATLHSDVRF